MRVAVLNWYANRSGGADVYTRSLCKELSESGHDVHFIGYEADEGIANLLTVHRIPKPTTTGWRWRFAAHLQYRATSGAIAALKLPRPDVIIASPPFAWDAMHRLFPDVPSIYLPHARIAPVEVAGYLPGKPGGMVQRLGIGLYAKLEARALRLATRVVRFTAGNVTILEDYYRLPLQHKSTVIPLPIDLPQQQPRRDATTPLRILSVGRLIASKNLSFLLTTLAKLNASQPAWRLDIVGDGPERGSLEAQVKTLGLSNQVTFHGRRNDPETFYAQADLFAFPTKLENTPLVILEAMAHGVPTLAIKSDGIHYLNCHHELIDTGEDGIIASDENDFAVLLAGAIAQPSLLEPMAVAARVRVEQHHSVAHVADQWEKLLKDVAKLPSGTQKTTGVPLG